MPLLKLSENKFPEWSEVKKISQLTVESNSITEITKSFSKYALFVISGECSIRTNGYEKIYLENDSHFSDKKIFQSEQQHKKLKS